MTKSDILTDDTVSEIGQQIDINVDDIRDRVAAVLGQSLYWFPVRHHSPSVARHLQSVILKRKPKMIFIEGPFDANHMLKHVVDAATKPPVAIYSSYRDDDNVLGLAGITSAAEHIPARFASWYPMLSYSPEYVAMKAAEKIGAKVTMMDLPHHALIKPANLLMTLGPAAASGQDPDDEEKEDNDAQPTKTEPKADAAEANESNPSAEKTENAESQSPKDKSGSERLITESSFYQKLAEVAGFRTFNEAWDSLFEIRNFDDVELFRRELATFCAAARATANVQHVRRDGTLDRERFMMRIIRKTIADEGLSEDQCMVICGGFHLFLNADDDVAPPEPPAGTVYTTIVPYSYFRVSELAGYGAGNRAPQYYQSMWDLHAKDGEQNLLIEHVVNVLKQARKEGEALSSADAISTCQHAEMLARLRGRPAPILDDIHDALITCCVKGDPRDVGIHLLKAIDHADIGTRIGRVTEALGQLPIVNDFYRQLDELQLSEVMNKEKRVTMTLDRREELASSQSSFLHRSVFLEVPFASQTDAPSGDFATGTLFKERWALRWSPGVEATLIEKNLYGDTIESAALARLREQLAKEEIHAGKTSAVLLSAANMDLPNLIHEVEGALSKAIDSDSRFVSLAQALINLVVIERYAIYRNVRTGIIDELITRCFDRACFSILDIIAVPEEQQQHVMSALMSVAEIVQRGDRKDLDRDHFIEHVKHAADATEVPFLRGVLLGILAELRVISPDDLATELSALAKAPQEIMATAGDFLDGIMAASRTSIMLGAKSLVAAIDELLRAAEWDPFLTMVPRMRAAFERLHDQQKDSIAETVAKQYGLEEADSLLELRTSVGAAAVITKIDQRVSEIMKRWDF